MRNNPNLPFCDDDFIEKTLNRYTSDYHVNDGLSYATVKDYCDSFDFLNSISQHGDLKNVQRPWALKAILSKVPVGGKILEFGGGDPVIAAVLAQIGYNVTIVDPYDGTGNGPVQYEKYLKDFPEVRLIRKYFTPSMNELDREEGSFDAVYSISVIEHMPFTGIRDAFRAMQMYLKPKGLSIHAIDYIFKGEGDIAHKELIYEISKLSGISQREVDVVLAQMGNDIGTYYLSAEAHNNWRLGKSYDEFPMRSVVSMQLVTNSSDFNFQDNQISFCGGIEVVCNNSINGYCINNNAINDSVDLRIVLNNKEIGRIIANLENDDLRKLGVGNGKCGFYFEFPDELSNIDLSKINVLPNNCNTPLPFIHNSKLIFDDTLNMSNLPAELIFKASQLDNLFIVNHIPKTAGTSLRNAFGKILLDKNILYHYNNVAVCSPEIWNWKFASNQTVKDNDLISLIIEKPINLIMGHFGFPEQNGFDKFISIFPCAKSIVFLRNPKDHICSLYHFSCKYFGENKSFKDFIMQSHVINYQTTALCGIGIDQLSFVGLVECFAESLKLLNYKYNLAIDTLSLNKGDDDRFEGYNYGQFGDENVWLNFEELNQLDYLLYEKAKERFDQEKKDFLFER